MLLYKALPKSGKDNSFCIPVMDRMRSHRIKLQEGSFRLDISKCNLISFYNSPLTCPSQSLPLNACSGKKGICTEDILYITGNRKKIWHSTVNLNNYLDSLVCGK